jgi:hypothetical protein
MKRILVISLSALTLAGCASEPSYDKSAVPEAAAAAGQAGALCEKEQTLSKFNASKFMACRLAAERNFVIAVRLPKLDAFDTYASQMTALAADYDAGRIDLKQMDARAAAVRFQYLDVCNCGHGGNSAGVWNPFVESPIPTTGSLGVQN